MGSENQFLIHALLMGIFVTFLYDILRIARRVVPHKGFLVSLEDLCFWVYCTEKVFLLMHRFSNGMLRWFAVLGALAGMLLYRKLASPVLVTYASLALLWAKGLLRKTLGFLLRPFCLLWRGIRNLLKKAAARAKARAVRCRQRGGSAIRRILKKKLTFLAKVLRMTI